MAGASAPAISLSREVWLGCGQTGNRRALIDPLADANYDLAVI